MSRGEQHSAPDPQLGNMAPVPVPVSLPFSEDTAKPESVAGVKSKVTNHLHV